MKSKILLLLTTIALAGCQSKPKEMHLFILMGQSNMSGYGDILPQDTIHAEGIYYIPTITDEPYKWKAAAHPLHNRLNSDRFGLGLPFAAKYRADNDNVDVGLIPVGWGGEEISNLNKGTTTYEDAIKKAKAMTANDSRIKIKGVLWHQGESDTVTEEKADQYGDKLKQLVIDIRNDLNIANLPFIAGNLAEFYGTGPDHCAPERVMHINKVKQSLRDLPNQIENCGFVESTGCSSHDQHMVHFNRDSYIILGERYSDQITEIGINLKNKLIP